MDGWVGMEAELATPSHAVKRDCNTRMKIDAATVSGVSCEHVGMIQTDKSKSAQPMPFYFHCIEQNTGPNNKLLAHNLGLGTLCLYLSC
jgi:hypothetical protein